MLAEWWSYLATRCSPEARRMGYLRESIAIRARYRRCRHAWAPHLAKTRQALTASLECCRQRRTALVLGSGLLLDVPLAELAASFEEVWLVDMVHLPAARREAARYPNARCIEWDVTECAAALLDGKGRDALAEGTPSAFLREDRVDWVGSVNLLSQLPLLPLAWLGEPPSSTHPLAVAMMRRHLDYLSRFRAVVCLVADAEQRWGNREEAMEGADLDPLLGLSVHAFDQWWWELAPPGEAGNGHAIRHRVLACHWPSGIAAP